jgi:hypothetical protein
MAGDWIKLHRKLLQSSVFQNSRLLHVWIWCLLNARHQGGWADVDMELPRGSFACGTISAAAQLSMSRSAFVRHLDSLRKRGMLVVQADNKRTRITICNYDTYQSSENCERTATGQPPDNERTTSGQRADTKEEGKKERRKEVRTSVYSEDFTDFWTAYPRKLQKGAAWKAYQAACRRAKPGEILEACRMFSKSPQGKGEYCPYPATWLNGSCWEDDPKEWQGIIGSGNGQLSFEDEQRERERRLQKTRDLLAQCKREDTQ